MKTYKGELPPEDGWYWWRPSASEIWTVTRVGRWINVRNATETFVGPIPEPPTAKAPDESEA